MLSEGLIDNARSRGAQLTKALEALKAKDPRLTEIRGPGLMIASEFHNADGTPASALVAEVITQCSAQDQLLLMACGPHANVVRWMPPLVVTEAQVDQAVAAFSRALARAT